MLGRDLGKTVLGHGLGKGGGRLLGRGGVLALFLAAWATEGFCAPAEALGEPPTPDPYAGDYRDSDEALEEALGEPASAASVDGVDDSDQALKEALGEAAALDPYALVAAAIDHSRGLTSRLRMTMLVHRPDWQRRSALLAWTRGRSDALIRFTAPPRDAGNATLRSGERMWTFTPKLNRVVRLPFSLMAQSWAGSDFSYNDLSRSDDLLNFYRLILAEVGEAEGRETYRIDAFPLDEAPVVWGKEEWVLRDDHVLLSQTFFDQRMQPLKRLQALDIGELGGRRMAVRMRMSKLDEAGHYTEMEYLDAEFDLDLPDSLFTTFSLQSGGPDG